MARKGGTGEEGERCPAVIQATPTGDLFKGASESKQDEIIAEVQPSTDMEGGGKVAVGVTAVEAGFSGTTKSILITADLYNTGVLYIGKSDVTSTGNNAITFIEAGESVPIEYGDADNAVWVVASIAAQNFFIGALL